MMKHYFLILAAALLCVMCDKTGKEEEQGAGPDEAKSVTFVLSGGDAGYSTSDLGTKSGWDGSKAVWTAGDAIRLGVTVDGTWQGVSDESGAISPKFFISDPLERGGADAQFSVPTEIRSGSPYRFYAAYPAAVFDHVIQTDGDARAKVRFTIPWEQTPSYSVNSSALSFDRKTDIMVGVSDKYNECPSGPVQVSWKHLVTHCDISIEYLPGLTRGEVVKSVVLTAQSGARLTGKYELNLLTREAAPVSGETSASVTVLGNPIPVDEDGVIHFWISVFPTTITALTITVNTVNEQGLPVT